MKKVTVVFRHEEQNIAGVALRTLGVRANSGGGYVFDDVQYSTNGKMTELTRGNVTMHVPTRNILLVHIVEETP